MNNLEFGLHFAENLPIGVGFVVLSLLVTLLLLRRHIYSLFDPLLFYAILSAMGGSVVLYLYWFDLISDDYFLSYLFTQAAFLTGFLLRPPPSPRLAATVPARQLYSGPLRALYPMSVALFVGSQLLVYSVTGIPLFLESRLEAFSGGGGYGLFSRVIFVTSNIAIVVAVYRLLLLRRGRLSRLFDWLVVAFCGLVAMLSGSKGALLALAFSVSLSLYFVRRFYPVHELERRAERVLFLVVALSFPVAVAAISLQTGIDQFAEVATALVTRFLQSGEIYFMVYPDDILARLPDGNGLLALFYSPLGGLRLVDRDSLPVNLGLQAFNYHYTLDVISGPNARHNVFGLKYFGPVFSVVFSFLLGLLLSFTRSSLYKRLPATPMGMVGYVLVVSCAVFIEQDVSGQAFEYAFSVVLILPLLYGLSCMLSPHPPRRPSARPARPVGAAPLHPTPATT